MSDFWAGKKVLLTGHTGFVGSWLACVLKEKGAVVTGFALPEESGAIYGKIKERLAINSVYGDLRDPEAIRTCVEACDPDIIFHIAAFGFVKECLANPQRAYTCNVLGTVNLMNALKDLKHSVRILIASSDKVYDNSGLEAHLFTEQDPLGGSDPYSASKTCEDITARSCYLAYLEAEGSGLCVVRPSNILGGGDHIKTRLIPGIYESIRKGEKPEIRNPQSIRPWQHVLDMTDAYCTLAEKCPKGLSIYNVGPEPTGIRTVGEIAAYIQTLHEDTIGFTDTDNMTDHSLEKAYLGLSIEKICGEIGWRPKKTLEQTLEDVYTFYMQDDGQNTYDLCLQQIREYYG